MKKLIGSLLVLVVTLNSFSMAWAEDAIREAQLIKNVEASKVKYGELSDEHMQASYALEKFYIEDLVYRDKHKNLIVNLINQVEAKYGKQTKIVDDTKLGLAELYLVDGEPLKAIPYLEDMKYAYQQYAFQEAQKNNIQKITYSPKLSVLALNLANAYLTTKQLDKAETELSQFFEYIQTRDDSDSPKKNNYLIAEVYNSWAEVKVQRNNLNQALEYQAKSLAVFEQDTSLPIYRYAAIQAQYDRLNSIKSTGESSTSREDLPASSNYISASHDEKIKKGDLDGAIKLLELHISKLEADSDHNQFQLGQSYLLLSYDYGQKYQAFKNGVKKPTNVKDILNQAKWLDLSITFAKKSIVTFKDTPHAEPQLSVALFWLAFVQIANDTGDVDELTGILHASIQSASQSGPENILAAMSKTLLSFIYAAKEKPELSIFWGKQAINTLQTIKQTEDSLNTSFKGMFDFVSRMSYEFIPTLMFYQGRSAEAQQVLQMLKERELYESLRDAADDPRKMRLKYTPPEQAALDGYNKYLKQQQADKKTQKTYDDFSREMKSRLNEIDTAVKITPSKATQNNDSVVAETTALQKAINGLAQTEPAAAAIGVQYLVTKNKLIILLTVPNAPPVLKEVPIASTNFYTSITQVTLKTQNPEADAKYYAPALKDLYALLITPILTELKKYKAKTLMLSLDSQLKLLPFAALIDSYNHYLLESYTVALYNEAANQALEKPSNHKWRVAAMGLSKSVNGLKALTAVPNELEGILKTIGIEGDEYLDATFTRGQFIKVTKTTDSPPYNVLHVASHFELQPSYPGESSLYMGDGTKFSLKEMSALPLNFKNFDLVTYSACQTAVTGSNDGSGKEIESLSAQTQRQGAQAVMATLWKVSDQSTAKLMQDYYAQRNQGLNKAEALRSVQLNMALGKAGNINWKSPHHWAGFVISGNWR